jgi:hypothetical protein
MWWAGRSPEKGGPGLESRGDVIPAGREKTPNRTLFPVRYNPVRSRAGLSIHPDGGREARIRSGAPLTRGGSPPGGARRAHQGLRESSVLETLRLTGAMPGEGP